jgi:hypothetical protein
MLFTIFENVPHRAIGDHLHQPVRRGRIKVTLLGAGCPPAVMNRFDRHTGGGSGQSALDAGRGITSASTK